MGAKYSCRGDYRACAGVPGSTKMKVVICTIPMRPPGEIAGVVYPVDGNKALEYHKPVHYAINGVLHNVLQKGEAVQFIFVMTAGENSCCTQNREIFIREFEQINAEKGLLPSYADVEIPFQAVKQTYNKLITDLAEKVPENAEIYADMTFGSKPEVLSLFCALIFVENFRNAVIQYIVYGKAEFNKKTRALENPVIFDLTSLYYLFKVLGTMQSPDAGAALDLLKDFFAL